MERFAATGLPDAKTRSGASPRRADRPGERGACPTARRRREPRRHLAPFVVRARGVDHAGVRQRRAQRGAELGRCRCRTAYGWEAWPRRCGTSRRCSSSIWPVTRRSTGSPFTALNTGFMRDGGVVHVPAGVDAGRAVHLLFVTDAPRPAAAVIHPRNLDRRRARRAGHGHRELRDAGRRRAAT